MSYDKAVAELKHILENQKTVSVAKLNRLLQTANISVGVPTSNREIDYLKGELRKARAEIKEYRKREKKWAREGWKKYEIN